MNTIITTHSPVIQNSIQNITSGYLRFRKDQQTSSLKPTDRNTDEKRYVMKGCAHKI